jgi:hypothetical protein
MKRSTSIWEKEKAQLFGRMKRSTNIREYEKELHNHWEKLKEHNHLGNEMKKNHLGE